MTANITFGNFMFIESVNYFSSERLSAFLLSGGAARHGSAHEASRPAASDAIRKLRASIQQIKPKRMKLRREKTAFRTINK